MGRCAQSVPELEIILAALYLRGLERPAPVSAARWRTVANQLRAKSPTISSASKLLRSKGLWEEALTLESPKVVNEVERLYQRGGIMTALDRRYPIIWLESLGASAPPAFYVRGEFPAGPYLGAVGSRELSDLDVQYARGVGRAAAKLGYCVVSGGARGADSEAVRGALRSRPKGATLEILPMGFESCRAFTGACQISLSTPSQPFTAALAMERNMLIYSLGSATVIIRARHREGGTWNGAREAMRRKLARLIVQYDPSDPASRALCALGAAPLLEPSGLDQAIEMAVTRSAGQPRLFSVEEPIYKYSVQTASNSIWPVEPDKAVVRYHYYL